MQQPNLDRMYETFIKIGEMPITYSVLYEIIKTKLLPTVGQLKRDGDIEWYSFLICGKKSGVPTNSDDENSYFHLRFSLPENSDRNTVVKLLPDYCLMTRKVERTSVESVPIGNGGMMHNPSLFKQEKIEEVWRIIGEQSEFILNVFNSFKDNVEIPPQEIGAFLHYCHNMVAMSAVQCKKCGTMIFI